MQPQAKRMAVLHQKAFHWHSEAFLLHKRCFKINHCQSSNVHLAGVAAAPACSQLVEVNAHSLFSKWFSESGKLVSKLFGAITELVEEPQSLVFVLIDEVESLTAARKVRRKACDCHVTHLPVVGAKTQALLLGGVPKP
jgi:hypothetical protein